MRCVKCHRPLKNPPIDGMGPTCAKAAKPIPAIERDLFGFNVPAACDRAVVRLAVHIEGIAAEARIALQHAFAAARRRLGVWHV